MLYEDEERARLEKAWEAINKDGVEEYLFEPEFPGEITKDEDKDFCLVKEFGKIVCKYYDYESNMWYSIGFIESLDDLLSINWFNYRFVYSDYYSDGHGNWHRWCDIQESLDREICDKLHDRLDPCLPQVFFDAYRKKHLKKFGKEWESEYN